MDDKLPTNSHNEYIAPATEQSHLMPMQPSQMYRMHPAAPERKSNGSFRHYSFTCHCGSYVKHLMDDKLPTNSHNEYIAPATEQSHLMPMQPSQMYRMHPAAPERKSNGSFRHYSFTCHCGSYVKHLMDDKLPTNSHNEYIAAATEQSHLMHMQPSEMYQMQLCSAANG